MFIAAMISMGAVGLAPLAKTTFDFGGFPTLESAQISTLSADVKFALKDDSVTVSELILFKNMGSTAVDTQLTLPRYRQTGGDYELPTFAINANWDKAPLTLIANPSSAAATTRYLYTAPLTSKVHFGAGATIALRASFVTSIGHVASLEGRKTVGYQLSSLTPNGSDSPGQVNFAFSYTQHEVFGLPKVSPAWKWEIGQTGAAVRLSSFKPETAMLQLEFYPGDFDGTP